MKGEIGNFFAGVIALSVTILIIFNLFGFFVGLIDGSFAAPPRACGGPWSRLDYLVPTHALGCWLREVPREG